MAKKNQTSQSEQRFEMKTNFEGLIQLLAQNLYSEPDVFIRELIQNAHDGISRRKRGKKSLAGKIEVFFDDQEGTIRMIDNGIGMDEEDIRSFLSVIGSTGTGTEKKEMLDQGISSYDLIGQFGIGMLSAFVVAKKVIVNTKKEGTEEAFSWENTGTTECILRKIEKEEIGTEIIIIVGEEYHFTVRKEYIEAAIKKYCDLIEYPIFVNNDGPINSINAPWHVTRTRSDKEKELEYSDFIRRRFNDLILDIIPIEINEPYVLRGALFISDQHNPQVSTSGVVDIFIRRMFIRANDNEFLPPWAKFISGIIESPDLKPTAARDNIQRNEDAYQTMQKQLGNLIVERLAYLSEHEPAKFKRINIWHHYHLKGMALAYQDFFDKVGELLLFQTNNGLMTLKDYLSKNKRREDRDNKIPIYFFEYSISSVQFYSLAEGKGLTIIDGGRRFESELITKYANLNSNEVFIEKLDASDDPVLFARLDEEESIKFKELELIFERQLRIIGASNVQVRMRKFEPQKLPSVIILTPENEAEGKLKTIITRLELMGLEEIGLQALEGKNTPIFLSLNANNTLIKQLPDLIRTKGKNESIDNILAGIFHSAFMYAQNLIIPQNLEAIHMQYLKSLNHILKLDEKRITLQVELEQERKEILQLKQDNSKEGNKLSDHILLFMIAPFSEEYKAIEEAIRLVFEMEPFCFEVRLARDYTHETSLLGNIRTHINHAHGFIAEISDWNPNVMLELGAVLIKPEKRPIFALRDNAAEKEIPVDIKELMYLSYEKNGNSPEDIATEIRKSLIKNGKIIHEGLNNLLKERKAHYLSKDLINNTSLGSILSKDIKESISATFSTVEALANATDDQIKKCGVAPHFTSAIIGEVNQLLTKLN